MKQKRISTDVQQVGNRTEWKQLRSCFYLVSLINLITSPSIHVYINANQTAEWIIIITDGQPQQFIYFPYQSGICGVCP